MSFPSNKSFKLLFFFILVAITGFSLWNTIELLFVYHKQQPIFFTDFDAFKNAMLIPGGLADYLGSLFSVLYNYPIAGVVTTTAIIAIIPVIIHQKQLKSTNQTIAVILSAATWIITLIVFTDYSFKQNTLWVLIGSLLFLNVWTTIAKKIRNTILQVTLTLCLIIVNFMVLGGPGLILTFVLFLLSMLLQKGIPINKKFLLLITGTFVTFLLPILSVKIIYQITSLKVIYFGDFVNDPYYTNPHLFYVLILLIVFSEVWPLIHSRIKIPESNVFNLSVYAISGALLYILPLEFINKELKKKIAIDYYAYEQRWDKVLTEVTPELLEDYTIDFQVNRALYHQGKMLDNLSSVPQTFGAKALLIEHSINNMILMPTSDIYYDMGLINESRHWAHEAYTKFGKQPRILKRLVQVNIINKKYDTAKKYILLLKKTLVNKRWAENQEKLLYNESEIAKSKEYSEKREQLVTLDFFTNSTNPEKNLIRLIQEPGNHKMAFEYLIAFYLLKHELGNVINSMPEFRKYGFETLPKLVQESIPLYMITARVNSVDLSGYTVSKETYEQFNEYTKQFVSYKNNDYKAKEILDTKFSDTFWYYIHFKSPITRLGAK